MEMAIYAKAPKEVLEQQPEFIIRGLAKEFYYKRKRMKGVKVFKKGDIQLFENGRDFIMNTVTVCQRYDVFKKPRFIK